jgi:hypothetical protein
MNSKTNEILLTELEDGQSGFHNYGAWWQDAIKVAG